MNTQPSRLPASSTMSLKGSSPLAWGGVLGAAALLGLIAHHARMGAVSPRIANPDVTEALRPVPFLLGWQDRWLVLHEWGTVVAMIAVVDACVRVWRR